MSTPPKNDTETAQLLLEGIHSGKLELVAEHKLEGHPFESINMPPPSIEKAYFTVYCYDPEWAKQIEAAGLVARSRSTGFSQFPDGRQASRYKLHGEFEKRLREGIYYPDGKRYLKFGQTEQGRIDLMRHETEGNRRSLRLVTLSCEAFGQGRLFLPFAKEQQKHFRLALAKAVPMDGMDDVLLIASNRDQDSAFEALKNSGIYAPGMPRYACPNVGREGQVCALYIPAAVAESIRSTSQNQTIDFSFESPDIAPFNDAIENRLELTQPLYDFMNGESSPEDLCKLAAQYWPPVPVEKAHVEYFPEQLIPEKDMTWRKPMFLLLREAKIGPEHYTIIRTCQADGQYNYRLQVNEDEAAGISNRDLWMIADQFRCNNPLNLERANLNYGPERLRIAPNAKSESEALAEIAKLEEALGSKKIEVEDVPFRLQLRGLGEQEVIFTADDKRHVEHMAIAGLTLASALEGQEQKHYLVLAASHMNRLSDKHLSVLGLRKGMKQQKFSQENEIPAVIAIEIAPHVAACIKAQQHESTFMASLMSGQDAVVHSDIHSLQRQVRDHYQVIERPAAILAPVSQRQHYGAYGSASPSTEEEKTADPVDRATALLNKYPPSSLLIQEVQQVDEETGEPAVHRCLTITQPVSGNNYDRLHRQLGQLKDDEGAPLIEREDMVRLPGHDNRQQLFQINYLPEELLEGIMSSGRSLTCVQSAAADAETLAKQARDYFKSARSTQPQETSKKQPSAVEQFAERTAYQLAVRFPDAHEWQDYSDQFAAYADKASSWEVTPVAPHHGNTQLIRFAQSMERISPAVDALLRGVMAVNSGATSIHEGLPKLAKAQRELAKESEWMNAQLDDTRTASALLIPDVGRNTRWVVEALAQQGLFTRSPQYFDYKKHGGGRDKRLRKTQACLVYPGAELIAQLKQLQPEEKQAKPLNLLPQWLEQTEQNHPAGQPVLLAQDIKTAVIEHFDVQAISHRKYQLQRPSRTLAQVSDIAGRTMHSHMLMLRERYENPVDGKAEQGRKRKIQGVGVDAQDKGSQLVMVAALDSRNVKSFLRQVYDPLYSANLLAGQKIYEANIVHRARSMSDDEQTVVTLRQQLEDITAMVQQQDLGYRSNEQYRQLCISSPPMFDTLKDDLRLSLRIFERLAHSNPELHEKLCKAAGNLQQLQGHTDIPAMLVWPALLSAQGLTTSMLATADIAQLWQPFQKAATQMMQLQQNVRENLQRTEDEASLSRHQVKTHDAVLGVSHTQAGIYDLQGNLLTEKEIETHLATHRELIVKCYLSPESEQLSAQLENNPLRHLKTQLAKQADVSSGRRDVALPESYALQKATGKYTSRLKTESDLDRQLHYALSNDNAITAKEMAVLMGLYFDSNRQRGR